jgi:hypothetical protein
MKKDEIDYKGMINDIKGDNFTEIDFSRDKFSMDDIFESIASEYIKRSVVIGGETLLSAPDDVFMAMLSDLNVEIHAVPSTYNEIIARYDKLTNQ